jgi:hypothetical protein
MSVVATLGMASAGMERGGRKCAKCTWGSPPGSGRHMLLVAVACPSEVSACKSCIDATLLAVGPRGPRRLHWQHVYSTPARPKLKASMSQFQMYAFIA